LYEFWQPLFIHVKFFGTSAEKLLREKCMSSIQWEDFERIHVVRKIREVIGSWFSVDILLVDDQGKIRNSFKGDESPRANFLMKKVLNNDVGWEYLSQTVEKVNSQLMKSNLRFHEFVFLPTVEGLAIPIVVDEEYFGAVVALGYRKDPSEKAGSEYLAQAKVLGFSEGEAQEAYRGLKNISVAEVQYFRELSELVAQEIVTLHKEISSRDNRIEELNQQLGGRYRYESMIGKSKPMQELYALLDKIKASESTVLIQGKNGTGKELIAKAIHFNSPLKDKVFLPLNCAAFNDNLLESELFGHVKGSFTGAIRDRKGCFEMANGGTLFMDEIGDVSPAMQVKLLRVLQDGTYTPVGGTDVKKTKVRIVAATNRDLKTMVEDGSFRQDLFYRLAVIGITVPALKDRKEDILLLAEHFLAKSSKEKGMEPKVLTKRAIEKLYDFDWPGNIRELENEMERVTVLAGTEKFIGPEMLSSRIRESEDRPKVQGARLEGKLKDALENLERDMIREGLRRTGWNKSRLAKELGISRAGLIMKVEKYDLDKRRLTRPLGKTGTEDF
jgi:transcriptional regulator with GAF, ATPase, and Fis domain